MLNSHVVAFCAILWWHLRCVYQHFIRENNGINYNLINNITKNQPNSNLNVVMCYQKFVMKCSSQKFHQLIIKTAIAKMQ